MPGSTVPDLTRHATALATVMSRAPSLHNAQPWRLRVTTDTVELHADRGRHLPVADPDGRQLHLGLGAALLALRLAVADLRGDARVELLPDPDQPDLAARLYIVGHRDPTATESALLAAIASRRTVRTPFTAREIPVPLRVALGEHALAEGARLRWVETPGERHGVAALVTVAEHRQLADPAYRAELANWTSSSTLAAGAGVPPTSYGVTAGAGHAAPFPLRDFAGGREVVPPRPADAMEDHPVIAALCTDGDRPADWLTGGQALLRVLLAATTAGLASSQLNQPIEIPALRGQLRDELRLDAWPQLLLRLGHPAGPLPPPTPRQPVTDILLP